jgi:hypothetical protein
MQETPSKHPRFSQRAIQGAPFHHSFAKLIRDRLEVRTIFFTFIKILWFPTFEPLIPMFPHPKKKSPIWFGFQFSFELGSLVTMLWGSLESAYVFSHKNIIEECLGHL